MVEPKQDRQAASARSRSSGSVSLGGDLTGFVQRTLILLLVVALATIGVLALQLLCVVFAGVLFGVFLHRISRAIQGRTRIPYRLSLGAVIVSLLGLLVGMGFFVAPRLSSQLPDLSAQLTSSVKELHAQASEWGRLNGITDDAPLFGGQLLGNLDAGAILGGAFSSISTAVTAVLLVLFVGVFLAIDPGLYRRGFLLLIPPA